MAKEGVPNNPRGMHRRQTAHRPSQAWAIYLEDAAGGRLLVGHSRHPEKAAGAEFWIFTSVHGTTWTEGNNQHYYGMLRLKEEYGAAIAGEAQVEAAKADDSSGDDGPGHEDNPLVRKAIEDYAVKYAKQWLEDQGWVCETTGKPFDLRCTKGDQELHAEVKGTRGTGKVVELTRKEVLHNQEPCTWETTCDEQALFVVSGITLTGLTPSGGKLGYRWPWEITGTVQYDEHGGLVPKTYDYTVPELTVVESCPA